MKRNFTILVILGAVTALLLWLATAPVHGATSTLTGTIQDAQGNGVNGFLTMQLPVGAQDTASNTAIAPSIVRYKLVNGVIQSGPPLYDVTGLQPANLYYMAKVYDSAGNLVMAGNYVVTGASFNLGAASPTSITTSNISFLTPTSTTVNNTFTGSNTFTQQLIESVATGTAPFSITSTTLVPNLNVNVLNGVTVTGTPTNGQLLQATGATTAIWGAASGSGASVGCTNSTPVTVSNTTTATNLLNCTLGANTLLAGSMVDIELSGTNGTGSAMTITVSTALPNGTCSTLSGTTVVATAQPWNSHVVLSVLTTGVSGTANLSCEYFSSTNGGGVVGPTNATIGNPTFAVNTTTTNLIQITVTMSVANASNQVTEQMLKAVIL